MSPHFFCQLSLPGPPGRWTTLGLTAALLTTLNACGSGNGGYFPVGSLWPNTPENDSHFRRALSLDLEAMGKPVLWSRRSGESIRLLQTIGRTVRVVRLEGPPAQPTIRAVEYERGEPGRIVKHRKRSISAKDWLDAVAWLDGIAFWSLAAEIGDVALDASPLTLEHLSAGRFHVVLRYSNEDGVEDVERRLLSLAGLWCLPPEVQCHP